MIVYMSYDGANHAHGERLKRILQPMTVHAGFTTWSYQDTRPGTIWQKEMAMHLKDAMLFVPLVSIDFLASDRCSAEVTAALRLEQMGQLKIVPILLRPCFLEFSPFEHMPILPTSGKPITSWKSADDAWLDVQQGLLKVIRSLQVR